jgi:hypothetical protein
VNGTEDAWSGVIMARRLTLHLVLPTLAALTVAGHGGAPIAWIQEVVTPAHLLPFALALPLIAAFAPRPRDPADGGDRSSGVIDVVGRELV